MLPYAIDLGNGYTKTSYGNKPRIMPSYLSPIVNESDICDDFGPGGGAFLLYLSGARQDLIGTKWLLGEAAKISFPATYQRVVEASSGKIEYALQFALSDVLCCHKYQNVNIPTLYASLPDPLTDGEKFKKAVLGRHEIQLSHVNSPPDARFHYFVTIENCKILHEGQGAFINAIATGIIPSGVAAGIIDCGSGTTIAQCFSANGHLIPSSRTVSPVGVHHLLKMIATDPRLKERIGGEGNLHLIQQAIEDSSFSYGASNVDIEQIFRDHRKVWAQSALRKALEKFSSMKDEIDSILLVGGGAHIVKAICQKSSIILSPNPQTANVMGMARLAELKISRSVA
jgi:plasmid segregation protein ParM